MGTLRVWKPESVSTQRNSSRHPAGGATQGRRGHKVARVWCARSSAIFSTIPNSLEEASGIPKALRSFEVSWNQAPPSLARPWPQPDKPGQRCQRDHGGRQRPGAVPILASIFLCGILL